LQSIFGFIGLTCCNVVMVEVQHCQHVSTIKLFLYNTTYRFHAFTTPYMTTPSIYSFDYYSFNYYSFDYTFNNYSFDYTPSTTTRRPRSQQCAKWYDFISKIILNRNVVLKDGLSIYMEFKDCFSHSEITTVS